MSCIPDPRDHFAYHVLKPVRVVLQGLSDVEWAFPVWWELSFWVVFHGISLEPPNQGIGLEATFLELWDAFPSYSLFAGIFLNSWFTSDFLSQVQLHRQWFWVVGHVDHASAEWRFANFHRYHSIGVVVNLNVVSCVVDLGVQWYPHSMLGSSSTHSPLGIVDVLLCSLTRMTLFAASTCLLAWGCSAEEVRCLAPSYWRNSSYPILVNCLPNLVMMAWGKPYLQIMFFYVNFWTFWAIIFYRGSASIHLVK